MWPLRQNVQYNKQYFFKDIFIFVSVTHLILLGVLFVCESGKFHQERFVIDTKNLQSTIVFMPLKKRVTEQNIVTSGQKNSGARKVISYDEYQKKLAAKKNNKPQNIKKAISKKKAVQQKAAKPVEKKIIKPVEKKQPAKKSPTILRSSSLVDKQKMAKIAADKQKIAAGKAKALKDKANKAAAEKKKAADKKIAELRSKQKAAEDKKKLANKKVQEDKKFAIEKALQDKKKVAEDKVADKKKIEEQVVATPVEKEIVVPTIPVKEEIVSQAVQENNDSSDDEDTSDDNSEEDDLDNISFVGSRDLEMMQIKEQIQAEIIKYYKPPVGIAKKAICELSSLVGPGGKATRVVVEKGSGSIANDICARTALLKVTFPKEVIGREITIALGQ